MSASHDGLHLDRHMGLHNVRSVRSWHLNTITGCLLHKIFHRIRLGLSSLKLKSCRGEWTCELEFMRLLNAEISYLIKHRLLFNEAKSAFQMENSITYLGNFY